MVNASAAQACVLHLAGTLEPTIIYTLSKKEADEIGASLKVCRSSCASTQLAISAGSEVLTSKTKPYKMCPALQREGFRTGVYHAGLSDTKRADIHMQFLHDKLDVVRIAAISRNASFSIRKLILAHMAEVLHIFALPEVKSCPHGHAGGCHCRIWHGHRQEQHSACVPLWRARSAGVVLPAGALAGRRTF